MKFSESKFPILKSMSTLPSVKIYSAILSPETEDLGLCEIQDILGIGTLQGIADCLGDILRNGSATYYSKHISSKICNRDFPFLKSLKPFFDNCNIDGDSVIIKPTFIFHGDEGIELPDVAVCYKIYHTTTQKIIHVYVVLDGDVIIHKDTAFINNGESKYNILPTPPTDATWLDQFPVRAVKALLDYNRMYFLDFCVTHHIFRKFAPIESVIIKPGDKRIVAGGDKHMNESKTPVTHIDSKWFRNIVRLEGFAVRGHFRLQPKKVNGEWTKELIWINDFEKHGYTSKARILNQED